MTERLLEVKNLSCSFEIERNIFRQNKKLQVLNDINFSLNRGVTLGIVGESGCGKSTLCRTILSLNKKDIGNIIWFDKDIDDFTKHDFKIFRKKVQVIFQDPYGSLNPRMTIGNIISEPLEIYRKDISKDIKTSKVLEVMEKVGLSDLLYNRFPHELSGGQCQRVGIARSIINEPDVLICDEPVSSLDLSVQSQILSLLKELKISLNITMIFVSHDLAVVKSVSDEVMVLNQGLIVENNTADSVFSNPQNEYTRKLISSVPRINIIE
tara:strand:+ start:869 stop:1669 length:801 start_codon:yes stop_codon:yes gene_type:complete